MGKCRVERTQRVQNNITTVKRSVGFTAFIRSPIAEEIQKMKLHAVLQKFKVSPNKIPGNLLSIPEQCSTRLCGTKGLTVWTHLSVHHLIGYTS